MNRREFNRAFENHEHFGAVKDVARGLREAGYQTLLAGGCVRDFIMGRKPNDFDIATSATPDEVASLFPSALEVGKAFGVTILPFKDFQLEIATFREDLEYKDGRRPEGVKFSSPEADARRRDFTVNALFFDFSEDFSSGRVIDYVGGESDIQKRIIRTVGEARKRFEEDKLRILRAVRFAAQLDFTIEDETLKAVIALASELKAVSRERIRDELIKLLSVPKRVRGLEFLEGTGLLTAISPRLFAGVNLQSAEWLKGFEFLEPNEKDPALLLSLFFAPLFSLGRSELLKELKELRLDNRLSDEILFCHRHQLSYLEPETVRRGEMALLISHPASRLAERFAVIKAKVHGVTKAAIDERESYLADLKAAALTSDGKKPEPLITGEDAKSVGFKPGPELGAVLHEGFLLQLEGRFLGRVDAIEWLKSQKAQ